jgi:hypothetical protein
MRDRFSGSTVTVAIAVAVVSAALLVPVTAQAPASPLGNPPPQARERSVGTLKTPWGEPDLQGVWTDEFDTAFQRPPKYANQEFFTEAQRQEIDRERTALYSEERPAEHGTDLDVARAYNHAVFLSNKHVGARTSLIVDPPDGRIPRLTLEAQKMAAADREFRLALLQSTETCKSKSPRCGGGKYDPTPSPRRTELPPRFNTVRMNRYDGPEDGGLSERCLTGGLPEFGTAFGGSFRRIVQTPGGITMFYDVGRISVRRPITGARVRICIWSSAGRGRGQPRSNTS